MKKVLISAAVFLIFLTTSLCGAAPKLSQKDLNEHLVMAALWMKTSAEYEALCYQAYNIAKREIFSAATSPLKPDKPLAMIVDCDETVLGNMEYEVRSIGTDDRYSADKWNEWCQQATATAIPGAVDCLNYAKDMGVEVFYIGNRQREDGIVHVKENLEKLGFPYTDYDHILPAADTSDKQKRFDKVMSEYEVVVFIGDNMADFPIDAYQKLMDERNGIAKVNREIFGSKFILLPNPLYGGWESALAENYYGMTCEEQDAVRKGLLK